MIKSNKEITLKYNFAAVRTRVCVCGGGGGGGGTRMCLYIARMSVCVCRLCECTHARVCVRACARAFIHSAQPVNCAITDCTTWRGSTSPHTKLRKSPHTK